LGNGGLIPPADRAAGRTRRALQGGIRTRRTARREGRGEGGGQEAEDLAGSAGDGLEAVEGGRRSGTVPKEALPDGTVGGLDADTGVQA